MYQQQQQHLDVSNQVLTNSSSEGSVGDTSSNTSGTMDYMTSNQQSKQKKTSSSIKTLLTGKKKKNGTIKGTDMYSQDPNQNQFMYTNIGDDVTITRDMLELYSQLSSQDIQKGTSMKMSTGAEIVGTRQSDSDPSSPTSSARVVYYPTQPKHLQNTTKVSSPRMATSTLNQFQSSSSPQWLNQSQDAGTNYQQRVTADNNFMDELQSLKQMNNKTNRRLSMVVSPITQGHSTSQQQQQPQGRYGARVAANTPNGRVAAQIKRINEPTSQQSTTNQKVAKNAVVGDNDTTATSTSPSSSSSPDDALMTTNDDSSRRPKQTPNIPSQKAQNKTDRTPPCINDSLEILSNTARSMNEWVKVSSGVLLNVQQQMQDVQKEVINREDIPVIVKRLDVIESAIKELIIVTKKSSTYSGQSIQALDSISTTQQRMILGLKDVSEKVENSTRIAESNSITLKKQDMNILGLMSQPGGINNANGVNENFNSRSSTVAGAESNNNNDNTPYKNDIASLSESVESCKANISKINQVAQSIKIVMAEVKTMTREELESKLLLNTLKAQNERIMAQQSESKDQYNLVLKQQTTLLQFMQEMKAASDKQYKDAESTTKNNTVKILAEAKNAADKVNLLIGPTKSIAQNFDILVEDLVTKFPGLAGDNVEENDDDCDDDEEYDDEDGED